MKLLNGATRRMLQFGSILLATSALGACGGGNDSGPTAKTVSGTAAVGVPLANASITLTCKNGAGSATANSNGAYTATFAFDGPCAIAATSGATSIHSFAAGAGTFNVTPLTELLLNYIAGQLGTTVSGLLSGITSNQSYQSALSNSTVIANAQAAVAKLIKTQYGVTLSTSSFLSVSFAPGQPPDVDLDYLRAAGAITANGEPAASLATAASAAGTAAPISGGGNNGGNGATGGTGGSGGAGTTTK